MHSHRHRTALATVALLFLAVAPALPADAPPTRVFGASEADVQALLELNRTIELTPEQEKIRFAALDAIPAPCCSQFSAATCCCECNLTRATWGLAKHLIVERGLGIEPVREEVRRWHAAINPEGFSGRSCFIGGCARPFDQDGCGGMQEHHLIR